MNAVVQTEAAPAERSLSVQLSERQITNAQWHTLSKSLYPGASKDSVLMVIDYCRARNLDPLKKPCHIVPMQVKVGHDYEWRDVVLPGIYELRTTAMRTGMYLGHSKPEYGPEIEFMGVKAPEYVDLIIYRWSEAAQMKAEFPVRVRFAEACGTTWDKKTSAHKVNARWTKAPVQMMVKCAEAAGLREAFPDELGGQMTVEEMEGQRNVIDVTPNDEDGDAEKLSPKKLREFVEALLAAVNAGDAAAMWGVWNSVTSGQQLFAWGTLRSWERTAVKKLQEASPWGRSGLDLPSWAVSALQTTKDPEATWLAVQEAFAEADSEVPADIETTYLDRKKELGQ